MRRGTDRHRTQMAVDTVHFAWLCPMRNVITAKQHVARNTQHRQDTVAIRGLPYSIIYSYNMPYCSPIYRRIHIGLCKIMADRDVATVLSNFVHGLPRKVLPLWWQIAPPSSGRSEGPVTSEISGQKTYAQVLTSQRRYMSRNRVNFDIMPGIYL